MRVEIVQRRPTEQQNLPYMEAHHIDPTTGEDELALRRRAARAGAAPATATAPQRAVNPNDPSTWGKVGRNEACPCGSGKKYKHCHGTVRLSRSGIGLLAKPTTGRDAAPCPCS